MPLAEKSNVDSKTLKFDLYPNPVSEFAAIKLYLPEDGEVKSEIFNLSGQLVLKQTHGYQFSGENEIQLDNIQDLDEGAYVVRLSVGERIGSQRIIKKQIIQ